MEAKEAAETASSLALISKSQAVAASMVAMAAAMASEEAAGKADTAVDAITMVTGGATAALEAALLCMRTDWSRTGRSERGPSST